jgi:hypothetical protein
MGDYLVCSLSDEFSGLLMMLLCSVQSGMNEWS